MDPIDHLLITGGSGFVGQSLIDYLSGLECEYLPRKLSIVYFENIPSIPILLRSKSEVELHKVDLRSKWDIDIEPSHVVNLAANGSTGSTSPQASFDFIRITENFTEWLKDRNVQVVFQASSGACFGYNILNLELLGSRLFSEAISRETWDERKGNICHSRTESEKLLRNAQNENEFNLQIGRLFTFSGEHLLKNMNYALSQFFRMAKENGKIEVRGHPESLRSYMDARDMSRWIYKSLQIMPELEHLQIGSSVCVTIAELAEYVGSLFHAEVSYTWQGEGIEYYIPHNEATATLLSEKEIHSWKESIDFSYGKIVEARSE